LNYPPFVFNLKSRDNSARDLQIDLVRPFQSAFRATDSRSLVSGVDPQLAQTFDAIAEGRGKKLRQTLMVAHIGRRDNHCQKEAQGINQDVALAPANFLSSAKTP
jgi:hypothetical protein